MAHALSDKLGEQAMPPLHLASIEKNDQCQQEMADHPNRPCHQFSDMNIFWEPSLRARIDLIKAGGDQVALEALVPLIKSKRAVRTRAPCLVHGQECDS